MKIRVLFILLVCFIQPSFALCGLQAQELRKPNTTPVVGLLLLSEKSQPNIVFVTSTVYDGNLGGLAGADQQCQARAEAAGLPKNTYRAWLSASSVNAIDRLGEARGWVRVDGKPFADSKADLAAGKIFYPIRVNEFGVYEDSPYERVWTGTYSSGIVSEDTCNGWTSFSKTESGTAGSKDGVTTVFTSTEAAFCSDSKRLYCFGVDNDTPVALKPVAGRIAFHTKSPWIPSGGLAAADQLCMAEAQQAGLSGSFKALLATVGASAASRFDSSGQPWVRPDGAAIAPTAAAFFASNYSETSITQSADGQLYFGSYAVWTGGLPTIEGTAVTTCNDWTSAGAANVAVIGLSGFTYQRSLFGGAESNCNATWVHLYCLQE